MKIAVVFLLLSNVVYLFSQEKVYIKGIYEIRSDMKSYEVSKFDTISFERISLRESIRMKRFWIPWKKYKFKVKYANYGLNSSGSRFIIGRLNDISSLITEPWGCLDSLNYYIVVDRFSLDSLTTMECLSDESFFAKLKQFSENFSYYVKKSVDDKYCYHAYYVEGMALKYTYDKDEFIKRRKYICVYPQCISEYVCSDNDGSIDVYYLYNTTKIENILIPEDYIWKP